MKHFAYDSERAYCGVRLRKTNFFPASEGVQHRPGACAKCLRIVDNKDVIARGKEARRALEIALQRLDEALRSAEK